MASAIASLKSESERIVRRILNKLSSSKSQHYTDVRLKIGLKKTPTVGDNFIIRFLSRRVDANPSYLVIYNGRPTVKFVLRMTPPGKSCTGLHDVEREYRIMRNLHEKGFPVPEPLYLSTDEDDEYFDTVFFIREYVEGWNFTDASLTSVYDEEGCTAEAVDISASKKWKMLKSAVETLGQLHLYCGDDILGNEEDTDNGPGSIRSFWDWRVDLWKGMIPSLPQTAMTQNPEAAEFVKARDELRSATFSLSKRNKKSTFQEGFIHGDFNFRNLVFDRGTQRVAAVLDWEMACVGDVCCDLAEFLFCLLKPSQCGCSPAADMDYNLQGFTCEEWAGEDYMKELVKVYLEKVKCTPQKLYPHLYFAMAVACVRFAAIFLCANRSGYSGHECTPSCGLPVIQALLKAQLHFSHKYHPEQD